MEEWKNEFKEYEISELIEEISMGPFGSNIKVECFRDSGVPVLNGSNLIGFKLNENSFNYVTEEKADSLGKANAHRGDIVITHRGTLGQIVYIPEDSKFDRYVISQSQFRIKCNEKVLPQYLVYYFHTRVGQYTLLSNASQVGVPSLARPTTTFQKLKVILPPLPTQQKIAQILSSLDDKIELNNKINANLEQQAQALFKSWFVDFEPFGGEMPAGWKVGKLSEIAEITTDTFSPDKNPNIDVEHYSIPAFDETKLPEFQKSEELKSNKFHITKDTVLVSKLNPTVKRVWRPYCLTEKSISSTEFIVFKPQNSKLRDFLFSIVNSQEFNDFMCSHVTGSTNSHQRTPPKTTLEYEIPLNCDEEITKFCNLVTPMYDNIERNILENKKLSNLRDTLLPKLMNGEIEV